MYKLTLRDQKVVARIAKRYSKKHNLSEDLLIKTLLTARVEFYQEKPYSFILIKKSYLKNQVTIKAFAKYNPNDTALGHQWNEETGKEVVFVRAYRKLLDKMAEDGVFEVSKTKKTNIRAIITDPSKESARISA